MASGLPASGVGAMMTAGPWELSKGLDATVTAAVGAGLLLGAFNHEDAPGTIRGDRNACAAYHDETVRDVRSERI